MLYKSIAVGAAAALVAVLGATPAHSETFDKSTYLTFSAPVKIPGATLTPGTYWFHLTNPTTSRNVIQVLSRNGAIVYSQFHTIPDFRPDPTYESTVTFRETQAGVPRAIHSLFYGGERNGYEFVYPHQPAIVAEQATQPLPPASVPAPAPASHRVAENASAAPAAIAAAPAPAPQAAVPQPEVKKELPKTASSLPAVTLIGLGSILLAFGVHGLRMRVASV